MSQHCRANPCCGDRPCSGVPIPQHASGLAHFNKDAAPQPASVNVKPLKWRQGYRDAGCNIVQASTLPFYQIRQLDGVIWLDIDNHQTIYPSVEAAKAAAQSDYEKRIISALEGGGE